MKTLFFECKMGAAGDMMAAALFELVPEPEKIIEKLNAIGLPNVEFKLEPSTKCGITGKHFSVIVNGTEEESCDVHHEHCHHHDHEHEHCCCHENHHDHHEEHCHHHDHCNEHHHDFCHEKDEHENHCHHHDHCSEHHHDFCNEKVEHEDHCHHHEHNHDHVHEHCCGHGHHHGHCHNHDGHEHHHHHEHHGLQDIEHLIMGHTNLPQKVKEDVMAVYNIIAEAESQVHGVPLTDIHFHEVGSLDAVADITAVCFLINELSPDKIIASPIHLGSGQVRCAHGILPVPAPATALILKGVPTYGGAVEGELCTPTGAALLKHFVSNFGNQPVMRVEKIGYGMGKKDFDQANCIRAMLGEAEEDVDQVVELCCNLDDMTPEDIGFAMDRLFEAGAFEVYTTSVGMKKNRPGILLSCMGKVELRDKLLNTIFKYTTTIGVREHLSNRYILKRSIDSISVDGQNIRVKKVSGYGVFREKIEYEDLASYAIKNNISLSEARKKLLKNG